MQLCHCIYCDKREAQETTNSHGQLWRGKCVPVKQPPVVAFHMRLAKQWQHLLKHNTSSQGWTHYRISGEQGDPDQECESPFSGFKNALHSQQRLALCSLWTWETNEILPHFHRNMKFAHFSLTPTPLLKGEGLGYQKTW